MESLSLYIAIFLLVGIFVVLLKLITLLDTTNCCCCHHTLHQDENESNTPFVTLPEESSPTTRHNQHVYRVENERSRQRPGQSTSRNDFNFRDSKRKRQQGIYSAVPPPSSYHNRPDIDHANCITIDDLQENLRQSDGAEIIAFVQDVLLMFPSKNTSALYSAEDQCPLIIGVDATPGAQAGYCVNLREKRLNYYVIKREHVPWTLDDPKDPSEFEMKNFIFALSVWSEEICCWKKMCIYTDNFAITKASHFDDNKYGDKAFQVLQHFIKCKGVSVVNFNCMAVNRFKNLRDFAKYIQPADDLSRWNIGKAVKFLMKLYGIDKENVSGTHYLDQKAEETSEVKLWYKPSEKYQQVIRRATEKLEGQSCSNPSCNCFDFLQMSLSSEEHK